MKNLPVVDEVVVVLNLVCVAVAVAVNWWAARSGLLRLRTIHAAIAAIAGVYVAGYLWLLGLIPFLDAPDPARWSSVLRGLSLVAWVVVWVAPAVLSIRTTRELHTAIRERQKADL
jgi:hypothetical protein